MLKATPNPLLQSKHEIGVNDLASIECIHRRALNISRRELRDVRRVKSAADAITGFNHEVEIFGFTKGQFSLLDLLAAVIDITGPIYVTLQHGRQPHTKFSK